MTVIPIDPVADPRWDRFVRSHPSATVYHLAAWARIFEKAYRYTPRYLALEDPPGQLRAVMPLMSRLGLRGKVLRSMPVYEIGGPLASDVHGHATLMAAARSIAETEHARAHVDSLTQGLEQQAPGWVAIERPPVWVLALPPDEDGFKSWGRGHQRRPIIKCLKQVARTGVRVRESDSEEDLRNFYDMLSKNMRRKHSTNRTYRQLAVTKQFLAGTGAFRLFIAERLGGTVGGLVCLPFGGTVEALHIAHDERSMWLHPHHALYRYAMSWAVDRGYDRLSFGHAWPESGVGAFKARWGAEPVAMYGYAWRPGGIPESQRTHIHGVLAGGHNRILSWLWERTPVPLLGIATTVARRYL